MAILWLLLAAERHTLFCKGHLTVTFGEEFHNVFTLGENLAVLSFFYRAELEKTLHKIFI